MKKLFILIVIPLLLGAFLLKCDDESVASGNLAKYAPFIDDTTEVPDNPAEPDPGADDPEEPDDPVEPEPDEDETPELPDDLTEPGPFTKCTYQDDSLDSDGYSSALVYYPCERESGPFAATTLTSGWAGSKENMSWLADQLVTYGFIVIAMTPNNRFAADTEEWSDTHKAGVLKLLDENDRTASPLFDMVDTGKLCLMGYSKGGGGALHASNELGAQIRTVLALSPWEDDYATDMYDNIQSSTVCFTGTEDFLAPSSNVKKMYEYLPSSIPRAYIDFNGVGHLDWVTGYTTYHDEFMTLVIAWMKSYLDDEEAYLDFFNGERYQEEADNDWFNEFIFVE